MLYCYKCELKTFLFIAIYLDTSKLFQDHKLYDEGISESFKKLATVNVMWVNDVTLQLNDNSCLYPIIDAFFFLGNLYSRSNNGPGKGGLVHDYDSEVQYTDKGMCVSYRL